jgi:hypothetical protein
MHGAALLYNLLLAEQAPGSSHVDRYHTRLDEWWTLVAARRAELANWDLTAFWQAVSEADGRVNPQTRQFVGHWVTLVRAAGSVPAIIERTAARDLVKERERWLKRGRARIGNPGALATWNGNSGAGQLEYRWNRPVRNIINDILKPLRPGGSHA